MFSYRSIGLLFILWIIIGCNKVNEEISQKLVIGVVGYGEKNRSFEQHSDLQDYLSIKLKSIVEVEPAYNEIQAIKQIAEQRWDLAFASPGLAAIAIYQHQYQPILPLEGVEEVRSVIVTNHETPFKTHKDLNGASIALGQQGSATSYYLPIYNLYGLTLQKVLFSPTPQTSLKWLEKGKVVAAALSLQEYNKYRQDFKPEQFRIIHIDSHIIPPGAIIVSTKISPSKIQLIKKALAEAPSHIAASSKFLPNERPSEYKYLDRVIEKVKSISQRIGEQPALFYEQKKEKAVSR